MKTILALFFCVAALTTIQATKLEVGQSRVLNRTAEEEKRRVFSFS